MAGPDLQLWTLALLGAMEDPDCHPHHLSMMASCIHLLRQHEGLNFWEHTWQFLCLTIQALEFEGHNCNGKDPGDAALIQMWSEPLESQSSLGLGILWRAADMPLFKLNIYVYCTELA